MSMANTRPGPDQAYLSWTESAWHIVGFSMCAQYLFLPSIMMKFFGRTAWLIPVLAGPAVIAAAYATAYLCSCFPGQRFGQFLPQLIGKPAAWVLGTAYPLLWLGGAAINATYFSHHVVRTLLPETPVVVIAEISVGIALASALLGLKTIIRLSDIIFFAVAPVLIFVWIWPLTARTTELANLMPISWDVIGRDMITTVALASGLCHGYFAILLTAPVHHNASEVRKAALAGTAVSIIPFVTMIAWPIVTFGWPHANNFLFPAASFLETISFGIGFPVKRADFVLLLFFRLTMTIALVTYFYIAVQSLTDLIDPKNPRPLGAVVAVAGIVLAAFPFIASELRDLYYLVTIWMFIAPVGVGILVLLAALAWVRGYGPSGRRHQRP